jgi:hypothetical protein
MRTFRAGVMSVLVSGVVGALVLSACSSSSTGGTPQGGGSGASSSAGSPAPSFSSGSSAVPVGPQEFLSAADVTHDGFATRLSAVKQNKTSSASAQRKVFDCLALTTVLRPVPGTSVKAKGVRVFADAKNAHVIAQVVLHFASPAQAQRYGGVVVQRLAACPHPKLLLIGTGPEASNGTSEPVTTACDRSAGYTAVATRRLRNRSNSVVVSMLLVAAGPVFSLALLFGPLASNNPTMRSKVADALCARVRG